ncbi:HdeD family acid-resistance protein [Tabrizicola sp. BL-A-41-H6]|uniref:HdeD family acid-resistance protein n=1 Tax=Tabrizicola sp. BL-A-41-H6 TaxID=3421107 RepID=UPI003D671E74
MEDPKLNLGDRRAELAQKARATIGKKASELWWTFFVRGGIALLLGIAALFWPTSSISILLRLFGLFLVLDAAFWILGARRTSDDMASRAPGLLTGIIGVALLFVPATSARLVFVLMGVWALVTGAGYLLKWWRAPSEDLARDSARNVGLFALAGGFVLLLWPGTGVVALGWTLAILAFAVALVMFFLASRFRRIDQLLGSKRE